MKTPALLIPLIFALTLQQTTAQQPRQPNKTALVIGNSGYRYSPQLPEPAGEARAMKAALERIGFQVELLIDGGQEQMLDAVERFEELLKRRGGTALFHYGGHGVQVDGENYLLAVDREIPHEGRVRTRAVPVSEIIASMQASPSDTNIVILDACRDNPLPPDTRSTNVRGLAPIAKTPPNTLIAFSADSGQLAKDGLFTPTLLKYIEEPGMDIVEVLRRVRGDVYAASNRTQLPTDFNQLFDAVYLAERPQAVAAAVAPPITPKKIADGSSVAASLGASKENDRYSVSLSAGQTLTVYTTGSTDTFGRLQDSGGTSLTTNDDGGSGSNFRISHTVSEAGTYYIIVSGYDNATGSYQLHAAVSAAHRFRVSLSTVDAAGSTDGVAAQACQSDFGSGYDVAAWEDIKRIYAATPSGDRSNFITSSLGLSIGESNSLLVKRSNSEIYSGRRHYYITYHNGSVPGHYLQHDNIDSSTISLGSWWVTMKALCYGW